MSVNLNINTNQIIVSSSQNQISVEDRNNGVVLNIEQPITKTIEVTAPGPKGPKGDQGDSLFTDIGNNLYSTTSSLEITGSLFITQGITGSLQGTASWAINSISSSQASTTSLAPNYTLTSSFNNFTQSYNQDSSSFDVRILDNSGSISTLSSSFTSFSSSYNTGSFTGSFAGNGSGLTNISASSIVGLNLSQISSGSVSASISPNNGLQVNTNVTATSFTGSLQGTASFALSASSVVTELLSPILIDSNLGTRLQPTNSTYNGFIINRSTNGATGFISKNPDNNGNGAISGFSALGSGSTYYDGGISMNFVNNGYYISYLRNSGFIYSPVTARFIADTLDFRTGPLTTATSKLTINNLGNVNIPTGSLTVNNGITGSLQGTASFAVSSSRAVSSSFAATASFVPNTFLQNGNSFGTTATLGTNDNQNLQFETNGSTRMFIGSNGNIGIGTTGPSSRLQVRGNGATSATTALTVENSDSTVLLRVLDNGALEQGLFTTALGEGSHAEGSNTIASGTYSHAEGRYTQAAGIGSHTEGNYTQAIGYVSHAEGESTVAIGQASHTEGLFTKTGITTAFYAQSVVNGLVTLSQDQGDVSGEFTPGGYLFLYDDEFDANYRWTLFLIDTVTFQDNQTQIQLVDTGVNTNEAYVGDLTYLKQNGYWSGTYTIPTPYSHAEGESTTILGPYSHTEGSYTQAIGYVSHAEGSSTQALGYSSHAEGSDTEAVGGVSHAEGVNTKAIGEGSHAEGNSTQAIGEGSHAEGGTTQAIGPYSHAEGVNTQAIGKNSHAEGGGTQAIGDYSHAEGNSTIASGSYQHVQGQFNIPLSDESAFIIGNGTDDNNRSNLVFAVGHEFQVTGSVIATQGFSYDYGDSSNYGVLGHVQDKGYSEFALYTVDQSDDSFGTTRIFANPETGIEITDSDTDASNISSIILSQGELSLTNTTNNAGPNIESVIRLWKDYTQLYITNLDDTESNTIELYTDRTYTKKYITTDEGFEGNYLQLNTSSLEPIEIGKIVWNSADGTFDMGLLNGVTLQAGQEMYMYAKASGAISNGDAVQFAGSQGSHLLVKKAVPSEINVNPEYFIGVATQDIINNDFGYITVFGQVRDIDTTIYTQPVLYFQSSGSTPGLLTDTRPTGPNAKITVAAVVRSHQTQGSLFIRPHMMPKIGGLQDIEINTGSLATGDILLYNSASQVWTNSKQLSGSYGLTGSLTATSFTGSLFGTASFASTVATSSLTGSFVTLDTNQTITGNKIFTPVQNTTPLTISGYSLTGSNAQPLLDLSGTWNTTGTPTLIKANVTNTASNANSLLMDLQVGGSSQFQVRRDGRTGVEALSDFRGRFMTLAGSHSTGVSTLNLESGFAHTGGDGRCLRIGGASFIPTSGTGRLNLIDLSITINQTGGANGITRGLFIDPTLTSAADWRSIEWSNNTGIGLYGSGSATNNIQGNTGIGLLTTPSAKLQVRGNGSTSATTALRVENSNASASIVVLDSGNVGIGTTSPSSGSLTVQGNIWAQSITGSLFGTASWADNSNTSSYALTASYSPNYIEKSVGPTYTTNAILTVTQAEYDAIVTKDPTTLYFIV